MRYGFTSTESRALVERDAVLIRQVIDAAWNELDPSVRWDVQGLDVRVRRSIEGCAMCGRLRDATLLDEYGLGDELQGWTLRFCQVCFDRLERGILARDKRLNAPPEKAKPTMPSWLDGDIYYLLLWDEQEATIKIGISTDVRKRARVLHGTIIGVEPDGGFKLERERHEQFEYLNIKGRRDRELFEPNRELINHIVGLRVHPAVFADDCRRGMALLIRLGCLASDVEIVSGWDPETLLASWSDELIMELVKAMCVGVP